MPLPVADLGISQFPQRSKNRRISVSPNDSSGTARRERDDPELVRTHVAISSPPESDNDPELNRLRAELASVRGQVARLEHERYLLSRGVPEEDLDYYAFKIEHMDSAGADFKKAAKEYLRAHPVRRTAVSSGADLGAGSARKPTTSNEMMNQLLRNR